MISILNIVLHFLQQFWLKDLSFFIIDIFNRSIQSIHNQQCSNLNHCINYYFCCSDMNFSIVAHIQLFRYTHYTSFHRGFQSIYKQQCSHLNHCINYYFCCSDINFSIVAHIQVFRYTHYTSIHRGFQSIYNHKC